MTVFTEEQRGGLKALCEAEKKSPGAHAKDAAHSLIKAMKAMHALGKPAQTMNMKAWRELVRLSDEVAQVAVQLGETFPTPRR